MSSVYRVYGIEFTGKRSDIAFPLARDLPEDSEANMTGFESGSKYRCTHHSSAISEETILEAYGISKTNPLEMKFQDFVLLNDLRVCQFVEDFIAGYEYAGNVIASYYKAVKIAHSAKVTAKAYGLNYIDKGLLLEQLLENGVDVNQMINCTGQITDQLYFVKEIVEAGFYTHASESGVGLKLKPLTVGCYETTTSLLSVSTNMMFEMIDRKMYEQYRSQARARLVAAASSGDVVKNVYIQ